jgi:tetratricopeptide (TPR) repeat protein
MWSPTSSEAARAAALSGDACRRAARVGAWLALCAVLAACSSHPKRINTPAPQPVTPAAQAAAGAASTATPATASPANHPDVPPAARADFQRAVNYMRSGNSNEAELGFKQIAAQYPQFAAPLVNLAIMQRKEGHLEEAEKTLKSAVEREKGSAVAWTELGVTQRERGEFKDAAASYEQAISADPHYAPAWRNLGVLSDLYLGDPKRALEAFEQYKQLTGEEKPVSGWIAELRQRLGMPPAKRLDSAPAAPGDGPPQGAPGNSAPAPASPAAKPQAAPAPGAAAASAGG